MGHDSYIEEKDELKIGRLAMETYLTVVDDMTDQDMLKNVFKSDLPARIRTAALRKIEDQSLLEREAINQRNNFLMREAAITNLKSQRVLRRIAWRDPSDRVRSAAIRRINSLLFLKILRKLAKIFHNRSIIIAISNRVSKLKNAANS